MDTWVASACVRAKPLQSCRTLCDPKDPDSSIHGISQVRILEWVAISFSRDQTPISCLAGGFFTTEPPGKQIDYSVVKT